MPENRIKISQERIDTLLLWIGITSFVYIILGTLPMLALQMATAGAPTYNPHPRMTNELFNQLKILNIYLSKPIPIAILLSATTNPRNYLKEESKEGRQYLLTAIIITSMMMLGFYILE